MSSTIPNGNINPTFESEGEERLKMDDITDVGERDKSGREREKSERKERGGGRVVVVGSGDMTRAMVTCLVRGGHRPVVATRNPDRARWWVNAEEADVVGVSEGVAMGGLVIVAIPAKYHHTLPIHLLSGKVVVDISNRTSKRGSEELSLAEQLQTRLPESYVVKALNTVSSYVLQRGDLHRGREVPICGDSEWARAWVSELVRDMALAPVDMGSLKNAIDLEDIPLSFFSEWKLAAIVAAVAFLFFWIICFFRGQICPNLESDKEWNWSLFEVLPLNNTQFSLAFTACSLLLICYIPGLMAAYLQLYRGTKYSPFPDWLDSWLKGRKQLGLMALLLGASHGCMAIFTKISLGQEDVWWQQLYVVCGVLLLAVLVILGITSLPSVSTSLTWREFSVVQRYLGWSSVVLVTTHMTVANIQGLLNKPKCIFIVSGVQILVPLCFLTLLLKVPLLLPFIGSHLDKIRGGYERPTKSSKAAVVA